MEVRILLNKCDKDGDEEEMEVEDNYCHAIFVNLQTVWIVFNF